MIDTLLLLLGVAGWIGGGWAALALLDRLSRPRRERSRAERAGFAVLLGVGLTAWLQFLLSLLGGPLGTSTSLVFAAGGSLLGIAAWGWRLLRRTGKADGAGAATPRRSASAQVCQLIILGVAASMLMQSLLTPQRLWDERAIFGVKAAVLFEDGGVRSPALRDPDFVQGHPRYPLLLPLAEQHLYALLGRVDDRLGKLVSPVLMAGLATAFAGVLSRRFDPRTGWLWGLLLSTVPALSLWDYGCLSAQADAPLACFHGASVLCLWDWLRGAPGTTTSPAQPSGGNVHRPLAWQTAAGLFGGLALFTKDEGIAFVMIDAAALALLTVVATRSALAVPPSLSEPWRPRLVSAFGASAMFVAAAAAVTIPWLLHRRTLPTTNEMQYFDRLSWETLTAGADRAVWGLRHVLQLMFGRSIVGGPLWWGVLAGIVLHPRRAVRPAELLLLLDLLGGLAGLIVAGVLAPLPVEDHLGGSANRFLLQLTPTALLLLASLWSDKTDQ